MHNNVSRSHTITEKPNTKKLVGMSCYGRLWACHAMEGCGHVMLWKVWACHAMEGCGHVMLWKVVDMSCMEGCGHVMLWKVVGKSFIQIQNNEVSSVVYSACMTQTCHCLFIELAFKSNHIHGKSINC
ncbi:hypothetical protein CEXT_338961 [Caerostris extrusa]|uniref:Uncharacterized protein n=1 Tax=Caerostris extrusa TaxID=172846 RepID=A0AAV4QWH3_CAEEX|nr:hypothetical protein CEXT_338961 [Caerostris extrusa]